MDFHPKTQAGCGRPRFPNEGWERTPLCWEGAHRHVPFTRGTTPSDARTRIFVGIVFGGHRRTARTRV
eukprot:scaffold2806_cov178-Amphora_coffeaeformis.AAC.4